ncbi:MAG: putative DNA binding domain-containing protein, partial [Candidatus Micrarchaeota archaeon]|nr:putative DNA binding domain-containing protein [Candidatus Micrarchaeota archaeon]
MEIPTEERRDVEFKESLSDFSAIIQSIVAFSNSAGGRIFIGVDNNGNVKGMSIGKHTLDELATAISQATQPRIYPEIEKVEISNKSIIVITIHEGSSKPYLYKGTGYKRIGTTNVKLDLSELENLILKKHVEKTTFDNLPSEAVLKDINEADVLNFVKEAKTRRSQSLSSDTVQTVLQNLNLLKGGKILNGAAICFASDPQKFFPQFAFRCAVLKNGLIVNHQLIEGPLFKIIEDTLKFVTVNIQRSYVVKGAKREDVFEYPLEAIREAVINAAVHRDYFSNASCYLLIDENHIEIKNPGLLPEELKLEELKQPNHVSLPRNKLIARVAYLSGYIVQWGTGTTNIVNLCRSAGLQDPVFEEIQGFVTVSIYK